MSEAVCTIPTILALSPMSNVAAVSTVIFLLTWVIQLGFAYIAPLISPVCIRSPSFASFPTYVSINNPV
ncbi:hypothetical protein KEM48_011411 [Puccinia striiformis f. sp. tritici PST-130]|nr:hypothetical protein KEM48_011411 [Puccinia striiformis f. sp. tritici PST-130]